MKVETKPMSSYTTIPLSFRSIVVSCILCLISLPKSTSIAEPSSIRRKPFPRRRRNEGNATVAVPAEVCLELETECLIQGNNGTYINCQDFKYEPPVNASNCVRHAIMSGTITNIFNTTVVATYHIDTAEEIYVITEQNDVVEIDPYGKEVILCDKEGAEEVSVFDLFLHSAWKHDSSPQPIECEAIHEKLTLALPGEEIGDPEVLPVFQCNLEANLGFPYNDPDEAPYMGYSSEWLLVEILGAPDEENSYCYSGLQPEWCSYNNSGGFDSAYIGNVDDYYTEWAATDDFLSNETFTIKNIGGLTLNFTVSHFFWEKDYYHEYDCWSDHMLASVLTINNTVTGTPLNPEGGWSHPVDKDVKTHIELEHEVYAPNPEYKGDFYVLVTCSVDCICSAYDYTVL